MSFDLEKLMKNKPVFHQSRFGCYSFPEAVIEPGTEVSVKVKLNGTFRGQRLAFHAFWKVIRGNFAIKRSRMPLLNRDNIVCAFSTIRKYRRGRKIKFLPGRTTVQFAGDNSVKPFIRTYLPSSVVYIDDEPLHHVYLVQVLCNKEPALPAVNGGISTAFLSVGAFGNELPMPNASLSMTLLLKNIGDVQIRVQAMVIGMERGIK